MPLQIENSAVTVSAPASERTPHRRDSLTLARAPLHDGTTLAPVTLAYETWGTLAATADNVVLICHALTGDAHAADLDTPGDPRAGWWNPLIGPGRVFDTDRYFVVCSNVLGGCYGSTGPTSPHPLDSQPYGMRFPLVSIGDMVRAQRALLAHLGVRRLAAVAGGSIGGLQALEWAVAYPDFVERAIVLAAGARLGAQGIALNEIGRRAIVADPHWQHGDYAPGEGPADGLAIARMVAMLSYSSAADLDTRFGRRPATRPTSQPSFGPAFDVESYLQYQGEKLVRRFDANTYLILSRAMDRYDVADWADGGSEEPAYEGSRDTEVPVGGRDTELPAHGQWAEALGDEAQGDREAAALARVRASLLAVGVSSDWLFPPAQVRALADGVRAAGGHAQYAEIASPLGHDAFLKEWGQLDSILRPFLAEESHPQPPPLRSSASSARLGRASRSPSARRLFPRGEGP